MRDSLAKLVHSTVQVVDGPLNLEGNWHCHSNQSDKLLLMDCRLCWLLIGWLLGSSQLFLWLPGRHIKKNQTLDLFPSSLRQPKIDYLDLYTYVYICVRFELKFSTRQIAPKLDSPVQNWTPGNPSCSVSSSVITIITKPCNCFW